MSREPPANAAPTLWRFVLLGVCAKRSATTSSSEECGCASDSMSWSRGLVGAYEAEQSQCMHMQAKVRVGCRQGKFTIRLQKRQMIAFPHFLDLSLEPLGALLGHRPTRNAAVQVSVL